MIIRLCDGCRRRIGEDDEAVRGVPGIDDTLYDWCASCFAIIKAELPRLAAEAARALYETRPPAQGMSVQQRARALWPIHGFRPPSPRVRPDLAESDKV